MNTRAVLGAGAVAMALAAGCGGQSLSSNRTPTPPASTTPSPTATTAATAAPTATATATCQTQDLELSLGQAQGAAGSVYEPLRFTNKGTSACTLYGYPGVSFVTEGSGDQIGSPASRNPQHPAATVILAAGATAEAVLRIIDHGNYGAEQCKATTVSGLRVYPPGNKAAAYLPFHDPVTACSTDVTQLTVEAVAKATP